MGLIVPIVDASVPVILITFSVRIPIDEHVDTDDFYTDEIISSYQLKQLLIQCAVHYRKAFQITNIKNYLKILCFLLCFFV